MRTHDPSPTVSVAATIVASVIRIDVAAGDAVTAEQTVLVMESMKMEIPIAAPVAGTVTRVGVTVGDVVQEGDLLVEIARERSREDGR